MGKGMSLARCLHGVRRHRRSGTVVWPPILAWMRRPEPLGVEVPDRVRDDFLDGGGRRERAPRYRPQRDLSGGIDHQATLSVDRVLPLARAQASHRFRRR
jgi:hypothetical protein